MGISKVVDGTGYCLVLKRQISLWRGPRLINTGVLGHTLIFWEICQIVLNKAAEVVNSKAETSAVCPARVSTRKLWFSYFEPKKKHLAFPLGA
jgi:hypothetical protein